MEGKRKRTASDRLATGAVYGVLGVFAGTIVGALMGFHRPWETWQFVAPGSGAVLGFLFGVTRNW